MSLVAAAHAARAGLSVSASQIAIVSRNVGNLSDPEAHRKIADVASSAAGGVVLAGVGRAGNAALSVAVLAARSEAAASQTLADALGEIERATGETGSTAIVSAALARLGASLHLWSTSPADVTSARSALAAARDVVARMNGISQALELARSRADRGIEAASVELSGALEAFAAESAIIARAAPSDDVTHALDMRDATLGRIGDLIGAQSIAGPQHELIVMTSGGVMLFEAAPRSVEFTPTAYLSSGRSGAGLLIDGVRIDAVSGSPAGGRIGALLELRDKVIPTMQAQYDELARLLVASFAEHDSSGSGNPPMPSLFDWAGAAGVPAPGDVVTGLAGVLRINPAIDPVLGGRLERLRDGGATGPDDPRYVTNVSGVAGFATRLIALVEGLESAQPVDAGRGLGNSQSAAGFARSISAELSEIRSETNDRLERSTQEAVRAAAALSGEVGVNLDEEFAHMLELERSYQASSRLFATVDQMLASLLAAVA